MSSYSRIVNLLPSLIRPQPDVDDEFLAYFLKAVARQIDLAGADCAALLQTHWFKYSDFALFNEWFREYYKDKGVELPKSDSVEVKSFPYIGDLARMSALMSILPWPGASFTYDETVEGFRKRIAKIVNVFVNGPGTIPAMIGMTDALLPRTTDGDMRKWGLSFTIEENPPINKVTKKVTQQGQYSQFVSPLSMWEIRNGGFAPAYPSLHITGIESNSEFDPTEMPLLERYYTHGALYPSIGIAYNGTVLPGNELRVQPVFESWIICKDSILTASSHDENNPSDPVVRGPWNKISIPQGQVVDCVRDEINRIWLLVRDLTKTAADCCTLYLYIDDNWNCIVDSLQDSFCIAIDKDTVFLGCEKEVISILIDPLTAKTKVIDSGMKLDSQARWITVDTLSIRCGTTSGLLEFNRATKKVSVTFENNSVNFDYYDESGNHYIAMDEGVMLVMQGSDDRYYLSCKDTSDDKPDWVSVEPEQKLPLIDCFIPPVHALCRESDGTLWLGTAKGIARYCAFQVKNDVFTTRLEYIAAAGDAPVRSIFKDARGGIWFSTDNGNYYYFCGEISIVQNGTLVSAGDSLLNKDLGQWRFSRDDNQWQKFDPLSRAWKSPVSIKPSSDSPTLKMFILPTIVAQMGEGIPYSKNASVPRSNFIVRVKRDSRTVINGGIPFIPELPQGSSVWRYLQMRNSKLNPLFKTFHVNSEGVYSSGPEDPQEIVNARFDDANVPHTRIGHSVFAYHPSAKITMTWNENAPASILIRILTPDKSTVIDPAIIDRLWEGTQMVRPAGVKVAIALNTTIVKGDAYGT